MAQGEALKDADQKRSPPKSKEKVELEAGGMPTCCGEAADQSRKRLLGGRYF